MSQGSPAAITPYTAPEVIGGGAADARSEDIEQSLKVQSAAIESSRTAMSQTDDLVECVVEVLESLQTTVLDRNRRTLCLCRQLLRSWSGRRGYETAPVYLASDYGLHVE